MFDKYLKLKKKKKRTYNYKGQYWPPLLNHLYDKALTCLLISAPACKSHTRHSGCPPNAAICAGVWEKRVVTAFTSQPTCTNLNTHSSCSGEERDGQLVTLFCSKDDNQNPQTGNTIFLNLVYISSHI